MRLRIVFNMLLAVISQKLRLLARVWQSDADHLAALINYYGTTLGGDQSRRLKVPTTAGGEPLPWYTYPAIAYLAQLDLSHAAVFEFGAGTSSHYWARRARSVLSVESDPQWYATLQATLASNQELRLCAEMPLFAQTIHHSGQKYDLIVIDAGWRFNCALEAVKCLQPGGFIILDNSDWYPQTAAVLRANGFTQLDFIGWGPINAYAWCTSIFTLDASAIPRAAGQAVRVPGGVAQRAEDDKQMG